MRLKLLLLALPLAACASERPEPTLVETACAAQASSLVDARAPGLIGCANAVNLRIMVAHPADLDGGVSSTASSDEAAMTAVHRQRLGDARRAEPGVTTGAQPEAER